MSIGIPPRVGPSDAPVDVESTPAAAPEAAEKTKAPQDGIDRGPRLPFGAKGIVMPPTEPAESGAGGNAFGALAAQLGEPPAGGRVAAGLEATLPMFEVGAGLPSLAFHPRSIEATLELKQLCNEGTLALPEPLERAIAERFATITANADPNVQLERLPPEARAAIERLAAKLEPVFQQCAAKKKTGRARTQALRKRGQTRLERIERHQDVDPEELAELLEAFDGDGDDQGEKTEQAPAPTNHETESPIILPDAAVLAYEAALLEEWPAIRGLDEELVTDLLVSRCSGGGEMQALLEALDQKGRAAKTATRDKPQLLAECDALSERLTFFLERRQAIATMVKRQLEAKK